MKYLTTLLSAGALALAATLSAGCHGTYVAAGAGGPYYDYAYYPEQEVYFYPSASIYYWRDHDRGWMHDRVLPPSYHLQGQRSVSIRLNTDRPYDRHNETIKTYPHAHH